MGISPTSISLDLPWDEDHMTVIQELEITDGNQRLDAADMSIYDAN
jgi:hypothetical protein